MNVLVADDDQFVCESLRTILNAQPDIAVCALAANGAQAAELFEQHRPDVALLDIQMPEQDGLAAAERILAVHPQARIVFLTTFSDDDYIVRALRMGAKGYLIKQDVAAIAPALRSVMEGMSVLEGEVLEKLNVSRAVGAPGGGVADGAVGNAASGGASDAAAGAAGCPELPEFAQLTDREREVALLIAEGLDNKEIAAAAYMGEGTVRNHISSILTKMNLRNRTQIAVAYYRQLKR